jgi:hypothetical protein
VSRSEHCCSLLTPIEIIKGWGRSSSGRRVVQFTVDLIGGGELAGSLIRALRRKGSRSDYGHHGLTHAWAACLRHSRIAYTQSGECRPV